MKRLIECALIMVMFSGCADNRNIVLNKLQIAYVNGSTGALHVVKNGTDSIIDQGLCATPEWNPEGRKLAYASNENQHFIIREYDVATRKTTTIADLKGKDALLPRYGVDGRIWFMGGHNPAGTSGDDFDICYASDGTTRCFSSGGRFDAYPMPHPYLKDTVYYESGAEIKKEFFGIYMRRDEEVLPLFCKPHIQGNGIPHISGDGKKLVWECSSNSDYEHTHLQVCVSTLDSDGFPVDRERMLTLINAQVNATPRISEDGNRILFRHRANIFRGIGIYEYVLAEKRYKLVVKPTILAPYLLQQKYVKGKDTLISYEKIRRFKGSRLVIAQNTEGVYSEIYLSEHPLMPQKLYQLYNYDVVWVE